MVVRQSYFCPGADAVNSLFQEVLFKYTFVVNL